MTRADCFKFGFLLRCAEEGLEPEQIRERVKTAQAPGATVATAATAPVTKSLGMASKALLGLPLFVLLGGAATAALGGGAGGYALAKMQNKNVDPDEVKRQELMHAYKIQADRAQRRAKQLKYRQPRSIPSMPKLYS